MQLYSLLAASLYVQNSCLIKSLAVIVIAKVSKHLSKKGYQQAQFSKISFLILKHFLKLLLALLSNLKKVQYYTNLLGSEKTFQSIETNEFHEASF